MRVSTNWVTRRTFFTAGGLGALAALSAGRLAAAQEFKSVSPEVEKANIRVVNDFCATLKSRDMAKAASLLADKCAYRPTQTTAAVVGHNAVLERVKGFMDRGAEFKVLKTVALGPIVLNERDDIFAKGFGDGPGNAGPRTYRVAAGLFFVENGKIVEWTDYVIR